MNIEEFRNKTDTKLKQITAMQNECNAHQKDNIALLKEAYNTLGTKLLEYMTLCSNAYQQCFLDCVDGCDTCSFRFITPANCTIYFDFKHLTVTYTGLMNTETRVVLRYTDLGNNACELVDFESFLEYYNVMPVLAEYIDSFSAVAHNTVAIINGIQEQIEQYIQMKFEMVETELHRKVIMTDKIESSLQYINVTLNESECVCND